MNRIVQVWSLEEEIVVAKEYGKLSVREIAEKVNKTMSQVYSKIQKMKQKGLIEDRKDFKLKQKNIEVKKIKEGLDLSKLKLDRHKKYEVHRRKSEKGGYERHLSGYIIQETKELVTFKTKAGYCESFRKADLLIGEYKAKEL